MRKHKNEGDLTSRVGETVNYGPPLDVRKKNGPHMKGKITAEVWGDPSINTSPPHPSGCKEHCWGDYSLCSQLIEWATGAKEVRLAYYRRRCGEDYWTYASQMTISDAPDKIKGLLELTLSQKEWFAKP